MRALLLIVVVAVLARPVVACSPASVTVKVDGSSCATWATITIHIQAVRPSTAVVEFFDPSGVQYPGTKFLSVPTGTGTFTILQGQSQAPGFTVKVTARTNCGPFDYPSFGTGQAVIPPFPAWTCAGPPKPPPDDRPVIVFVPGAGLILREPGRCWLGSMQAK